MNRGHSSGRNNKTIPICCEAWVWGRQIEVTYMQGWQVSSNVEKNSWKKLLFLRNLPHMSQIYKLQKMNFLKVILSKFNLYMLNYLLKYICFLTKITHLAKTFQSLGTQRKEISSKIHKIN